MELFEVWKALAIVLTGAFGILGLATEFRHKGSKKITRWGYVSLAGIIVSTIGGVWAQFAEVMSNQKKAADDNQRILAIVQTTSGTLANTRKMMSESNQTTSDIRRILSPLGTSRVMVSWAVPCTSPAYQAVCQSIAETQVGGAPFIVSRSLPWPAQPHGMIMTVAFKPTTGGRAFLLSGNSGGVNPQGPRFRVSGNPGAPIIVMDELFSFDPPVGGALKGLHDIIDGEGSIWVGEAPYTDMTITGVRWIGERNDALTSRAVRQIAPSDGRAGRAFIVTFERAE
ncbi:MAG: hypothetical protein J7530_06240 [Novosphingobium sp.]|nr:hypothetical protein [Novosphingobium sp.]